MKNLNFLLTEFSYSIKNFEETLEDYRSTKRIKKVFEEANEQYLYERLVFNHLISLDEIKLNQDYIINQLNS